MGRLLLIALFAGLSLGCAITNYPVIFDSRGADTDDVMIGQYDLAYIVPEYDFVGIYDDGSRGIFNLVSQDWTGDQWIMSYENYDPTATVLFLDQIYCDPTFDSSLCPTTTAWNPNLPDAYPHGDQAAGYDNADNPYDYTWGGSCAGLSYASVLISYSTRQGECGSGAWADKQAAMLEFSLLAKASFRGQEMYFIPLDDAAASFRVNGNPMPIYGRYSLYMTDRMQIVLPVPPNARLQLEAIDRIVQRDGHYMDVDVTYGSLVANFKIYVTSVRKTLDRL